MHIRNESSTVLPVEEMVIPTLEWRMDAEKEHESIASV